MSEVSNLDLGQKSEKGVLYREGAKAITRNIPEYLAKFFPPEVLLGADMVFVQGEQRDFPARSHFEEHLHPVTFTVKEASVGGRLKLHFLEHKR